MAHSALKDGTARLYRCRENGRTRQRTVEENLALGAPPRPVSCVLRYLPLTRAQRRHAGLFRTLERADKDIGATGLVFGGSIGNPATVGRENACPFIESISKQPHRLAIAFKR